MGERISRALVPPLLGLTLFGAACSNNSKIEWAPTREVSTPIRAEVDKKPSRITNTAVLERSDPYWLRAKQEIYRSPEELAAQDVRERRRGQVLPKLTRGNRNERILGLTFDDGPHPNFTPKLLALLKAENVKATFFVIGKMVEKHPDLLKSIDDAGHEIANHTFSHVTLTKIPLDDIETEYRANNDIVAKTIGKTMRFCRPPGGDYDADVIKGAADNGLTTVLWTDDPGDFANPGDNVIARRTLAKLTNGGIVLLHDGVQQTLDVLPQVIEYARKRGFRFVTVSELQASLQPNVELKAK